MFIGYFEAEKGKFSKDSRAIVLKFNAFMTQKKHKQIIRQILNRL